MERDRRRLIDTLREIILGLDKEVREERRPHRLAYYLGGLQLFADIRPTPRGAQLTVYLKEKGKPPHPARLEVQEGQPESLKKASDLIARAWGLLLD
jgi:hypothetical protein